MKTAGNGILAAALALAMVLPQPTLAAGSPPLQFPLEYLWRKLFQGAVTSKSMAIAENGAYGIAVGLSDDAAAEAKALETCNERSKFLSLRAATTPPCQVLATGSTWKSDTILPSADWQMPAQGKDVPMQKGRKYLIKKSKGVILHVHGCNGTGAKVFSDVWGAYFNALGYDFYMPDSFAVKRPKDACGQMNDYPPQQISDIWRLRVAQTQRTLADLKKSNPGKPIYMWGHSEGGLIVQMVETEIAGIIVSGEECGAIGAPVAAQLTVPILYIWGEYDQYVNGMGGFKITDKGGDICKKRMPERKMSFKVIDGRSHIPWPWNRAVNTAMTNFIQVSLPPRVATFPATKQDLSRWKRVKPGKSYRNAAAHRAAAMNKSGTSYMVWGLDNEEDAIQLATFGCSSATSRKTNVFRSGKYLCAVVDVNGKPPK